MNRLGLESEPALPMCNPAGMKNFKITATANAAISMSTPIGLNGARPIAYSKNKLNIVFSSILVYAYFWEKYFF